MKKRLQISAILVVCFGLIQPIFADTLYFKDGQSLDCIVHEDKKIWKDIDDPNFYEIEIPSGYIGFWDEGQLDRIEKNDNYQRQDSETQAMMRKLIQENRLILPSAMIEGGLLLPDEMGKEVEGQILQVKNYAYVNNVGIELKLRLQDKQAFRSNQELSTARNSRLKFKLGNSIVAGLMGGSSVAIQRMSRAEHISTDEVELKMGSGQMWLDINPRHLGGGVIDRIQLMINDCRLRPTGKCLLHVQIDPGQQFRLSLLEGESVSVRVKGTPSGAQVEPGETLIVPLQGEKTLTKEPAPAGLIETWQSWDSWQPQELVVKADLMVGQPDSAPMLGEHSAITGDFGGQQMVLGADLITESLPGTLQKYRDSLEQYKIANGNYPSATEGLQLLHTDGGERDDPYQANSLPLQDSWGNALVYEIIPLQNANISAFASVRSVGPNGMDEKGLGDDVQ